MVQVTKDMVDMDHKEAIKDGDLRVNGEGMEDLVVTTEDTVLKEMDHREDLMADLKEVTETGTGMDQVPKLDQVVLEDPRVTCTVVDPTRPLVLPVGLPSLDLGELLVPKLPKKPRNTAAEAVMVATTAMVMAVAMAWKVIKAIEVVMHRTAVRKGTARAQAMVIPKESLPLVV